MRTLVLFAMLCGIASAQSKHLFVGGSYNTADHLSGAWLGVRDDGGSGFYGLARYTFETSGSPILELGVGIMFDAFGVPLYAGPSLRKVYSRTIVLQFGRATAQDKQAIGVAVNVGTSLRIFDNLMIQVGASLANHAGVDVGMAFTV